MSNKSGGTLAAGGSTTSIAANDLTMTAGRFTAPATLDINGNTLLSAGTLTAGTNITAAGNWTNNGGTFTPGGGTVAFDDRAAQAVNGTAASQAFNNVTVNKSAGTLSTGGSTTSLTTSNLTMTAGTFTAPATLDINGNTLLSAVTLTAGTNITAAGDWTNNGGALTPGANTVTFDGGGAQNLNGSAASQSFNNFTVNKGGGALTGGGSTTALNIAGNVTLQAGTFTPGTITAIELSAGNWTNNGATFTPGTSTVTFSNTTGAQSINGGAGTQTFNNIVVAKTAQTLSVAGSTTTLSLNGTMLLTSGTLFQPTDDREAVIVATLPPAAYTVVLKGVNQTSGIGLVEVYDNNQAVDSALANISSRGFVDTGNNVMIGGFTLGGSNNSARIAVRALGPSLSNFGLANVLADPTLELRNANGTIMISNDDWQSDPVSAALLTTNGLALSNAKEAGIFMSLAPPGQFTAIVGGKNGGIGIAFVEIYNLQ